MERLPRPDNAETIFDGPQGGNRLAPVPDAEVYERAIDSHVKNIRRKLERDPHAPRYLEPVYGIGYKLVEE